MKERGLIFNAEMVRAILDGRKTQTRRIAKLSHERGMKNPVVRGKNGQASYVGCHLAAMLCPFGQPGDRIWVRETWALLGNEDGCCIDWNGKLCKGDEREAARIYRASCEQKPGDYGLWSIPDDADWKTYTENEKFEGAWRPSIHMPRWASRITLEITGVRVERLNAISEEDARAEGVVLPECCHAYCHGFSLLWQSIYGEESWQANPWVWVISFKRVEGGAA
ncbi:hypothetical protein [Phytobacter sp. RSE-02]|uniref:hypothetical protein n=1 Tax=Phytobacter sp. RSE-02 TaxID=3229229 RepID=UPI00339D876B